MDLKEINIIEDDIHLEKTLNRLLEVVVSGTLSGWNTRFYKRWKRSHLDIIIRQDLIDLENVRQITAIETLIQLLRRRVGSPVSYSSLASDLNAQ